MKRQPQSVVMIDGRAVRYSIVKREGEQFLFIRFRDAAGRRLEKSTKATTRKAVEEAAPAIISKAYQPEGTQETDKPKEGRESLERIKATLGGLTKEQATALMDRIDWPSLDKKERREWVRRLTEGLGGLTREEAMALVYRIDWVSLANDLGDPEKSIRPGAEVCQLHPKEWYLWKINVDHMNKMVPTNRDWCETVFHLKVPGMIEPLLGLDPNKFKVLAEVYFFPPYIPDRY